MGHSKEAGGSSNVADTGSQSHLAHQLLTAIRTKHVLEYESISDNDNANYFKRHEKHIICI